MNSVRLAELGLTSVAGFVMCGPGAHHNRMADGEARRSRMENHEEDGKKNSGNVHHRPDCSPVAMVSRNEEFGRLG